MPASQKFHRTANIREDIVPRKSGYVPQIRTGSNWIREQCLYCIRKTANRARVCNRCLRDGEQSSPSPLTPD